MTYGSSGAPVLARSSYRVRIVSIISSGYKDGDGTVALGMELPALVDGLKAQLRAGRHTSEAKVDTGPPKVRRIGIATGAEDTGARFVKP